MGGPLNQMHPGAAAQGFALGTLHCSLQSLWVFEDL